MPETCRDAALMYLQHGWSVIPLRTRDKRPLTPWQSYQANRPSEDTVSAWYRESPDANVGIVTGAISGLVVLDLDGNEGVAAVQGRDLPITPVVETGGGGFHYYFQHPGGARTVPNRAGILPHVDVRGDGGYVVAPPSIHQSGRQYRWLISPNDTPLAPCPQWLLQRPRTARGMHGHNPAGSWRTLLQTEVPEGQRNQTVTRIAGYLLRQFGLDPYVCLHLVDAWNQVYCRPPLEHSEVAQIFNSIASREATRRMRRETDA